MKTAVVLSQDTRKPKKDHTCPIIMRLSHNGRTTSIYTGLSIPKEDWDEKKREIKRSYKGIDGSARLNSMLSSKKQAALSVIWKLDENHILNGLSVSDLRQRIEGQDQNKCFLEYALKQIEDLKKALRYGSARGYLSMYQVISKFHPRQKLPFLEISPSFLRKLENDYLSRGNSLNGLASILRSFRAVYNKAVLDGIIDRSAYPFSDYKIKKTPTAKRAITQESIQKILDVKLNLNDRLFHCRNYFLFSYLTFGMNFSDMAYIRKEDIIDGRIRYKRRKTKQVYDLKILAPMIPIIEFYSQNSGPEDYLFPIIRRQTPKEQDLDVQWARLVYNKDLKKLATLCGISDNLTSYVSRHSAATLALHEGVPVVAISRLLGHSSIAVTQTYLKSLPDSVIDSYQEVLAEKLK